jgi:LDH2 family malate/lactate/ureidoglycolate dehydrogenase
MLESLVYPGDVRIEADRLHAFGVRALMAVGVSEDHARMSADVLLCSDLRGIESHGFARFADMYMARLRSGAINKTPNVSIAQDSPVAATLDGDGGLGFVPGTIGMRMAIEKAKTAGIGMVAVRNSSHYGPGSPYALMALDEPGLIGISMTTAGNIVAPPGGAKRLYGSNVIAFVAPCRPPEPAFCLDMATSTVAAGKFEIARRRGKAVPDKWGIDANGNYIQSDPNLYFEGGAILPLGGDVEHGAWKGFGLSVMVDILCGVLSGGLASAELKSPAANHFFGALNIAAFTSLDSFYDQMASMKETFRASPRLPGAEPLTFAGEPEAAKEADYRANGVPFHPSILEGLRRLASEIGVEYDLD